METFGWPEFLFILRAAGWTVSLTAVSFVVGGIGGGILAILRLAPNPMPRAFAQGYILVIQSVPVLEVLFLSYFGLALIGIDLPAFAAAATSLSVYVAAYLAEIWRGSIESVPFQQWEASSSLAMTRAQQYRYVIIPQALRIAVPPTVGFVVQLVKNTSIVSVVGFVELAQAGRLVNNAVFQPFIVFPVVALIYFAICFPLSRLSRYLENVLNVGRGH
jgi:polar amino acid transport system permease protein